MVTDRLSPCLRRSLPSQVLVLCFAALTAPGLVWSGPTPQQGPGEPTLEKGEFDPAAWNELLDRYVDDGRVDYARWEEDGTEALDAYLEAAGGYDLRSVMGKEPRAAFLVNTYNAWAIRQILDHYPVDGVRDIPGFFDQNTCVIAGKERTLEDIEARLIEIIPYLPQVAFLLCPGAAGGPPLESEAYYAETLGARVRAATADYLGQTVTYDEESNQLLVPDQILRYKAVYDALPDGFLGQAARYLGLSTTMAVQTYHPEFVVVEIDWSLNDRTSAESDSSSAPKGKGR